VRGIGFRVADHLIGDLVRIEITLESFQDRHGNLLMKIPIIYVDWALEE
jgi:hypothetical protein